LDEPVVSQQQSSVFLDGPNIKVPVIIQILHSSEGGAKRINGISHQDPSLVAKKPGTGSRAQEIDRPIAINSVFPQAGFSGRAAIAPGTQAIRTSTGLELQVIMPVVNAPFRLYWAYNPNIVQTFLQPPIVADRSYFPNQVTFLNAVSVFGQASPFFERKSTFRFSIGRTF
jgi:hypothetical protein